MLQYIWFFPAESAMLKQETNRKRRRKIKGNFHVKPTLHLLKYTDTV